MESKNDRDERVSINVNNISKQQNESSESSISESTLTFFDELFISISKVSKRKVDMFSLNQN